MTRPSRWRTVALMSAGLAALGVAAAPAALAAAASTAPAAFTYTGTWGHSNTEYWSNQTNATATIGVNTPTAGATVKLRGTKHSGQGIEAVSIDGGPETNVNMYNSTLQTNVTVYTSAALSAGSHTLKVRVTGTKDSRSTGLYASVTGADVSNGTFGAPPANTAPVVNAGPDATVTLPASVTLNGSVTDDGKPNPPAATTATWSMVSGPGTVTFANPNAAATTATFSAAGSYVLRLTGSDSALTASDDVAVTVNAASGGGGTPVGVTLNRDFDTCNGSQWTGNSNLEAQSPSLQFSAVSSPTRDGSGCSGKFTIANDPAYLSPGGGYRSLYAQYDSNEGTTGGTDFVYGFSFLMPQTPTGTQLWELHHRRNMWGVSGNLAIAPHAIVVRNGQIQYREMTGSANWNGSSWTGWSNYQDQIVLDTAVPNTWYDMMIHIKASEGSDGVTQVWIRRAGQPWTTNPTWQNLGPSVPYIPGGLDPNVPNKVSITDVDPQSGLTGLYLEAGIYNPGTTYSAGVSPFVTYYDDLRRYTDVTSAKTGFPQ